MTEQDKFDDIPIGNPNADNFDLMIKAYEEKVNNQEQDLKALPFEKKIVSKNWKHRQEAYLEIQESLKNQTIFNYSSYLSNIFEDVHPVNQDIALSILVEMATHDNAEIVQIVNSNKISIVKSILDKIYSSKLQPKAKECITKLFEVCDDTLMLSSVFEHLISSKSNPKTAKSTLNCCIMIMSLFGIKLLNIKSVTSSVEELLNNTTNLAIKPDCYDYYKELFRWTNQRGFLAKLKDCYKIDLEKAFDEIISTNGLNTKPTKFNKQKFNQETKTSAVTNKALDIDFDIPVKLFDSEKAEFDEAWINKILDKSMKWIEKQENIQNAIKACTNKKIVNTSRSYLITPFKLLLKDSNVNVVSSIIQLISTMSTGLKKNFSEVREYSLLLIDKLKDPNKKVVNESMSCIETLINNECLSIMELKICFDKVSPVSSKENGMRILTKLIEDEKIDKKNLKTLSEHILSLTDDPSNEVRACSFKLISLIRLKFKNEIIDDSVISDVPELKRRKIEENKMSSVSFSSDLNDSNIIANKMDLNTSTEMNTLKNNKIIEKKQEKPKKKAEPQVNTNADQNEAEESLSPEEIESTIQNSISKEVVVLSNSNKWDERKQSFTLISTFISENPDEATKINETIVKFIRIKLKDFKENNFNILREAIDIYEKMVDTAIFNSRFTRGIVIKLLDKWSDVKLKQSINNLFMKLCESQTPKIIVNIILKVIQSKNINIIKEFALWIILVIDDFGISPIPVKEIVDFSKSIACHSTPAIRQIASNILCSIYKFLGEKIKNFLKDGLIKEATLKLIEAEFEKITVVGMVNNAKRQIKSEEGVSDQNSNSLDNLFPRADISKKITPKMIKDFNEGKWTIKKEILDGILKIFNESGNRILPLGLTELIASIKNTLTDGNKNLVKIIISFVSKLFEALGVASKQYAKSLIPGLLSNLSDKNNLLREEVIKCSDVYIDQGLFDSYISYIPAGLIIDNFEYRNDMLKLIAKHISKVNPSSKYDYKEFIPSITSCLMDKNPSIRNLAEDLLKDFLSVIHLNNFVSYVSTNFKPAQQSQLKLVFDKYSGVLTLGTTNPITIPHKDSIQQQSNQVQQKQKNEVINKQKETKEIKETKESNETKENKDKAIQKTPIAAVKLQQHFLKQNNIKPKHKQSRIQFDQTLDISSDFYSIQHQNSLKNNMLMYINDSYINDYAFSSDWNKISIFFSQLKISLLNDSFYFMEILDLILKWVMIKNYELNTNCFFNNSLFEFLSEFILFISENEFEVSSFESKLIFEILLLKVINNISNQTVKEKAVKFINDFIKVRRCIKVDWFVDYAIKKIKLCDILIKKLELTEILKGVFGFNGVYEDKLKAIESIISLIIYQSESTNSTGGLVNNEIIVKINSNVFEILIEKVNEPNLTLRIIERVQDSNIKYFLESNLKDLLSRVDHKHNRSSLVLYNSHMKEKQERLSISKSPIFINNKIKSNISLEDKKYLYCIESEKKEAFTKQELLLLLHNVIDNEVNVDDRIQSLFKICELVKDDWIQNKFLFENNITILLTSLISCLERELNMIELNFDIVKYALTISYKLVNSARLDNLTQDGLCEIYFKLLQVLLIPNLELLKKDHDQEDYLTEGKIILNSLNAILIILLERININTNINSLFIMILQMRKESEYNSEISLSPVNQKLFALIIKCIKKLVDSLKKETIEISSVNFKAIMSFLLDITISLNRIHPDMKIPTKQHQFFFDEFSLKLVKQIIYEIVKLDAFDIWVPYNTVLQERQIENEEYVRQYIQIAKKISNQNQNHNSNPSRASPNSQYSNSSNFSEVLKFKPLAQSNNLNNAFQSISNENQIKNIDLCLEKLRTAITRPEKIERCLELFNVMKQFSINNISFLDNKEINENDLTIIKKEWLIINSSVGINKNLNNQFASIDEDEYGISKGSENDSSSINVNLPQKSKNNTLDEIRKKYQMLKATRQTMLVQPEEELPIILNTQDSSKDKLTETNKMNELKEKLMLLRNRNKAENNQ